MRLQKQVSRRSGTTVYPKYVVVIPPNKISKIGWKEGVELHAEVKKGKIILKPKK